MKPHFHGFLPTPLVAPFRLLCWSLLFSQRLSSGVPRAQALNLSLSYLSTLTPLVISSCLMALNTIYVVMTLKFYLKSGHLPSATGSRQLPTWMSLGFSHLTFSTLIPWKSSLHPPTIMYNWSFPLGRPKPLVSSLTFQFLSLLKSNPSGNPFSSSFKLL